MTATSLGHLVEEKTTLGQVTKESVPIGLVGKDVPHASSKPLAEEDLDLSAVNRSICMIQGFRNHDIRILYQSPEPTLKNAALCV